MRYHFCLFSALQGVLFIAINRSDKVEDLGRDLGWADTCPLIGVQASELTDMLGEIVESPEAVRSKLETESARMRERAKTNDVALERLLAG
jgi:polysaccharide pyruvyl transferase WcaK-like protein